MNIPVPEECVTTTNQLAVKRYWNRLLGGLLLLMILLMLPYLYFNFYYQIPLHISQETTFFTEPVHRGKIDYMTALESRYVKNIPLEENLLPLLWEVLGSDGSSPDKHGMEELRQVLDFEKATTRKWLSLQNSIQGDGLLLTPSGDNGYNQILEMRAGLHYEIAHVVDNTESINDFPWLKQHLQEQADVFEKASLFLSRNRCEVPLKKANIDGSLDISLFSSWHPALSVPLQQMHFTQDLMIYAIWQFQEKNYDVAVCSLQIALHLCQVLEQNPFTQEGITAREQLKNMIYPTVSRFALSREISQEQKQQLRQTLMTVKEPAQNQLLLLYRLHCLSLASGRGRLFVATPKVVNQNWWRLFRLNYDKNAVMMEINRYFDQIEQCLTEEAPNDYERIARCVKFHYQFIPTTTTTLTLPQLARLAMAGQRARGQMVAKLFIHIHCPTHGADFGEAFIQDQEQRTRKQLLELLLAACEYRDRHGAFPAELQQLTVEFLREVPVDHFGNQPLLYRVNQQQIQIASAGADYRHGDLVPGIKKTDDIVVGNWRD